MKYLYALSLTIFLLSGCLNSKKKKQNTNRWKFESVVGSELKFKNGQKFDTKLYRLKYIGQITNGVSAPFLIFSGSDCDECDENISIYFHSPQNGNLEIKDGKNRYQYPGTERDIENDSLIYTARAFYGQVLPHVNGIIWYQQQLMDDNSLQSSVFMAKLNRGLIIDTMFTDTSKLKQTLNLLKQRKCKEIKGFDYKSEP